MKVLRGRSHFRSVVNVTFIALVALELVSYPFVALAYNMPAIDGNYLSALIDTGIFTAYLYITLLICTRLSTRVSKLIGALPVALFGFYVIIGVSDADEHTNYQATTDEFWRLWC